MHNITDDNAHNNKIGIAVIGCGYWGVNHVRVFSELQQANMIALCDQRPERLKELSGRFPNAKMVTSLDEVLRMESVQAVAVCTTAATHFDIVSQCLQAGKHVLVEKPMTILAEDAARLTAMAAERNLTLMVGHTFIYNNGVRKVKEFIENGRLGRVYYLYARRTNLGPIRQDVNALWDLATHDVAIFNYLLDAKPQWVSAVGSHVLHNGHTNGHPTDASETGHEDVGFVTLGYANGVIAHIHASWVDPHKVRELVVVGSQERIVFNDLNQLEAVRVYEKGVAVQLEANSYGEHQLMMRDGDIISPRVGPGEPLRAECVHFIECVCTGAKPITSGTEGMEVVQVMGAIELSMAAKGAPIAVSNWGTP